MSDIEQPNPTIAASEPLLVEAAPRDFAASSSALTWARSSCDPERRGRGDC